MSHFPSLLYERERVGLSETSKIKPGQLEQHYLNRLCKRSIVLFFMVYPGRKTKPFFIHWRAIIVRNANPIVYNLVVKVCNLYLLYKSIFRFGNIFLGLKSLLFHCKFTIFRCICSHLQGISD